MRAPNTKTPATPRNNSRRKILDFCLAEDPARPAHLGSPRHGRKGYYLPSCVVLWAAVFVDHRNARPKAFVMLRAAHSAERAAC